MVLFFFIYFQIIKILKISDSNKDLILVYKSIKEDVKNLILLTNELESMYNLSGDKKSLYFEMRERYNTEELSPLERASYFMLLNRTSFNGLYRVNGQGKYNTAWGGKEKITIFDKNNILKISDIFTYKDVKIYSKDFKEMKDLNVGENTFIYIDPSYLPISRTANFTSYTKDNFSEDDTNILLNILFEHGNKGTKFMMSNSDTQFFKK